MEENVTYEKSDSVATNNLAIFTRMEKQFEKDLKKAVEIYKKSSEMEGKKHLKNSGNEIL